MVTDVIVRWNNVEQQVLAEAGKRQVKPSSMKAISDKNKWFRCQEISYVELQALFVAGIFLVALHEMSI